MSNRHATKKTDRREHLIFDDREGMRARELRKILHSNAIIGGGYRT